MEMGDGSGMDGWVAASSLHCGRMLSTRQALLANQHVAYATITPPPTDETLIGDVSTFSEII